MLRIKPYERANDCRWWALHSHFRSLLSSEEITQADRQKMELILRYIHSLYTVYSKLFIFDHNGEIIASSTISESKPAKTFESNVSYRGHYIAVVNTRHMLGHKLSDNESLNLLVIRSGNKQAGTIAMIVDGLHRVLEINESMMQAVPITSTI